MTVRRKLHVVTRRSRWVLWTMPLLAFLAVAALASPHAAEANVLHPPTCNWNGTGEADYSWGSFCYLGTDGSAYVNQADLRGGDAARPQSPRLYGWIEQRRLRELDCDRGERFPDVLRTHC